MAIQGGTQRALDFYHTGQAELKSTERENMDVPSSQQALPASLSLQITVTDRDAVHELCLHSMGEPRNQFALGALRIGVLALRQASGQLDREVIKNEAERLLLGLEAKLREYSQSLQGRLADKLKEYFDPETGRFEERVRRLVAGGGELEQLLRRQIGEEDSALSRTLVQHFGEESPLLRLLHPQASAGLFAALRETLETSLQDQRERVLSEFSLDNESGALRRLVAQLAAGNDKLSKDLRESIEVVVKEFSLDQEDSALSRLVRNVEAAQGRITSEFSLDNEASALSRIKDMLESTNHAISSQLTLDAEDSALARLRRELLQLIKGHQDESREFQKEIKTAVDSLVIRRQEAQRSTLHGLDFEAAIREQLGAIAQQQGHLAISTGAATGLIKNCKKGDCIIEMGPDSAAAGSKFVVEAKEVAAYDLAEARAEMDMARKNRGCGVGLFVFSKRTAPAGLSSLQRLGDDVFVVWDAEDATALHLNAGFMVATALCVRASKARVSTAIDVEEMTRAILEVEKQAQALEEIGTWTRTIEGANSKIRDQTERSRKSLSRQVEVLQARMADLKAVVGGQSSDVAETSEAA